VSEKSGAAGWKEILRDSLSLKNGEGCEEA
jgi:hypothetical protein